MDFKKECQRILRQHGKEKRLVVGVSGGADSVALALVLHELGHDLVIGHLNHSLRGKESDADARFVKRFAQQIGVPCEIKKIVLPRHGNLEAAARQARYTFLEEARQKYGADAITVAHHQDDQIETILMNLYRGAGLRGLRGMQTISGKIIRPFLTISKKDILIFLNKKNQTWRHDRTNDDTSYLRNRIRHIAIPWLKKTDSGFLKKLLALSQEASHELERLGAAAEQWIKEQVAEDRFSRKAFRRLPASLKSEIIIRMAGAYDLYRRDIERAIRFIKSAASGKQIRIKGVTFVAEYDTIRRGSFYPSSSWAISAQRWVQKEAEWNGWKIRSEAGVPLRVRGWLPGDRFQPAGMQGTKKVQDFFGDLKIPRTERHRIPLIMDGEGAILAVGNLRWSAKAKQSGIDHLLTIHHAP